MGEGGLGCCGCKRGSAVVSGVPSKSGRGPDPAKGAAFITLLGTRVPSHCHPSRWARQPMGARREVRKAGGGRGGQGGVPRVFFQSCRGSDTSRYFLDRARTFWGFPDDHPKLRAPWVLRKGGSRDGWVGEGELRKVEQSGPWNCAKGAWD